MNLSEVQIIPVRPQNGLVAFASLVLDKQWYMGGIAIMTRPQGGYRLVYPTKKVGVNNMPVYYPINRHTADAIAQTVLRQYEEVTNNGRYDSPYLG